MVVDYLGVALVIVATTVWTRAAEIDGRHAVADHPWIWGLIRGAWTAACRLLWGFGAPALAVGQLVVVICMAAAGTLHGKRPAAPPEPRWQTPRGGLGHAAVPAVRLQLRSHRPRRKLADS